MLEGGGVRYDMMKNNCQKFANDLCDKLCGKGFLLVQGFGSVLADHYEALVLPA